MSGRAPTIYDVAELAGVGRTTVSRVLNGERKVKAATRDRVLNAVTQLRYKVNPQARLLAGGRAHTLMLVYPACDDHGPFSWYNLLIESGAQRGCAEAGLQLTINRVFPDSLHRLDRVLKPLQDMACDGVILSPPFSDDPELIAALKARHMPVACLAAGPETRELAAGIGMDDEGAGFDLTNYLLKLGHRRFAFILGLKEHISAGERFEGFCRALRAAGLSPADVPTFRGTLNYSSGVEQMQSIIDSGFRPTAVVCANDEMAVGALYRAHQVGLAVPRDMTVVGFDDAPFASMVWPPLTTIVQPIYTMAQKAAEVILHQIEGRPQRYELTPHRLVVRDSAAAPTYPVLAIDAGAA